MEILNIDENIKFNIEKNDKYVIVFSSKNYEPSQYTIEVYKKLKEKINLKNSIIFMDLSEYYSYLTKEYLYKWEFIENENDELVDEKIYKIKDIKKEDMEYNFVYNYIIARHRKELSI